MEREKRAKRRIGYPKIRKIRGYGNKKTAERRLMFLHENSTGLY